jgi:8-oxo-dGTP pyrophosphatase MutT (NUDIX family)
MRVIERQIVAGLIISKDQKILLGKKDPNKGGVYTDCWHIPGGGVNLSESLLDALKREILEEVGIDIDTCKVSCLDTENKGESEKVLDTGERVLCKMHFNVYKIEVPDDFTAIEVKLQDDLIEAKWVDVKELQTLKLTPPSIVLFKKLGWLSW